jgi:tetratricopeptide (TPR) repeat protein
MPTRLIAKLQQQHILRQSKVSNNMRIALTTILTILYLSASGQTAQEYLQTGIGKHEQRDLKGAIKDYDRAIDLDNTLRDAFFNRGTCYLALKNFKSAMRDFDKAIVLDPNFVKAYYSRASVYVSLEKFVESLPDLDKTIELDATTPNALTLRGQIRAQTGNKEGACEDFKKAKEIGDKQADRYLNQFCGNEQQGGESLVLNWPESENWRVGNSQENEQMAMLELIHSNETLENWSEIGTMMSIKGVRNLPMDKAMNLMYDQARQNSPKAKLTFLEKDETAEYPWIIFIIESPNFKNDRRPESQLWYVVQGRTSLYTNFRAIKKASIPEDLKDKWVAFFKGGKVVYK